MRNFRELKVWEKAHALTLAVYKLTNIFPRSEQYGLTSQLRRCSYSVGSTIAEGCGRDGQPELARFMVLEYQLLLARDLGFVKPDDYRQVSMQVEEVKRMLTSFVQRLRADS